MNNSIPHLLTILGPTASGKTKLACEIAAQIDGEVISADSRQVYRHMDIGTGKDLEEFEINGKTIPHHLINIKDPGYKYNIAEFQNDFISSLADIDQRQKTPILCGGSGLYIETALRGNSFLGIPMNEKRKEELEQLTDSELQEVFLHLSTHVKEALIDKTKQRTIRAIIVDEYLIENPDYQSVELPEFKSTIVGVEIERDARRRRITERLSYRMNHGLIEEVKVLLEKFVTYEDLAYYGLEYKWVGAYLQGNINKKELFEGLEIAIHQFSKRQMTWFRRMENQGYKIHWIDAANGLDQKVNDSISIYQTN